METRSFLKESVGGKSVVTKIVDNITNAIINGELKPGDKMPTEAELADSMGVGRNSVREAVKILEAYGVVHIRRAEGTFVSQEYDSKMLYPVLYGIILQKDASSQIIGLRKVIDVGILQLAIEKLKAEEMQNDKMEEIERAFEDLEREFQAEEVQVRRIYETDVAFHMAIVGITENTMLEAICNYVDKVTRRSRTMTIDRFLTEGAQERFLDLHRRIMRLLRERDAAKISEVVEEHYHYWMQLNE
ncbi:GntR family transcriptional regulator [Lachnoclostridium sp. An14]|uniref:FadR/GntR family transcriptional regulator n=1 Tax=Lachnoclostridium sp. An14 TaxID=1965562 RepID=UPI000B3B0416|nr:GntR family transcriptional regulator [Lachnoclostridium sp. An14]OUQ21586.1 GntR family transcriptional regulator [Lachnoclostridium sp. An14]